MVLVLLPTIANPFYSRIVKVPEDISVIGFDNISFASMCEPLLTTVSQPKYELGCTAMELLLAQIKGGLKKPKYVLLEHELVVRESTSEKHMKSIQ